MQARRVLITVSPIYETAIRRLQSRLEQEGLQTRYLGRPDEKLAPEELLELLCGVEIYIVGNARVPRRVIEGVSSLALINKYGVGVDNIDLAAAAERSMLVTNAPGGNAVSVAEMTIGLLISLSRMVKQLERSVREGGWRTIIGHELYQRTLGIIGLGNIGKRVATRARAFGMRVLANDLLAYEEFCRQYEVEMVDLNTLLAKSDMTTLHVPLTSVTRHMIGAAQLVRMRPGSILIHTARGGVVDEAALYEALSQKHLAAAAVDVFEEEPLRDSPLRTLDNVILTPHVAGITYEAAERIADRTWENVLAYLHGRTPPDLVA